MDFITTTTQSVHTTYNIMWENLIDFLPKILGALFVLALGFIVAVIFHKLAVRILNFFKIKELFDKFRITALFEKAGHKFNIVTVLASVIYWFVVIVFITVSLQMLKLTQISSFLEKVVLYLPNIIIAIVILVIGIILGNFLETLVKNTTHAAKVGSAEFLGHLCKWVVMIFSSLAALDQLKIAQNLIIILFQGFVIMLALAGGLAFGLGGKEHAKEIFDKIKK
jgi:hypothetical protein